MSAGYELYDASHIQRESRRRVRRLYGLILIVILVTLVSLGLGRSGALSMSSVAWILVGCWVLAAWVITWQLRRLRRTVWCLKVSADEIVGYDHARRKIRLAWPAIQRVDLTNEALVIVKSPHCLVEVPTAFPEFAALSHHIIRCADRHGTAVCIDGQPWQQLDVYQLYPFLTNEPPTDASGMRA